MRILAMWRYPVKSMLGERIDEVDVDAAGLVHDRGLALIDSTTGRVASGRMSARAAIRWSPPSSTGAPTPPRQLTVVSRPPRSNARPRRTCSTVASTRTCTLRS